MIEQAIFEFLKEHLRIEVATEGDYYGGRDLEVDLCIQDPSSGKWTVVSSDSVRLS